MGEYAKVNGERVKIGTCENMYYLRFDQRHKVQAESGSVDPVRDAPELRFRFPWPDEDHMGPGDIGEWPYERSVHVPGFAAPGGFEHGSVQFVAHSGYVTSLPCPESESYRDENGARALVRGSTVEVDGVRIEDIRVHRNGFSGAVHLVYQKLVPGVGLVPILKCGGCGSMWREERPEEIERLAVALRSEGDRVDRRERMSRENHDRTHARENPNAEPITWAPMPSNFWHTIADRVLAGITTAATT